MSARRVLIAAAGVAAAVGAASPAVASQGVGLDGSFSSRTYNTCTVGGEPFDPPNAGEVTGTWRVNLHDTKATARFVIYVGGAPHVAYTTQMTRVPDASPVFTATTTTGAGPLEVTLVGSSFSYTIKPYDDPFGGNFRCVSVVYTGTVS